MIIDCFTFFDELDLLEVRLNELKNVVDVFVLTESELTFTGKKKPLHFLENRERFAGFNIFHTIYIPESKGSPPEFERRQKQFNLDCAFKEIFRPGDIIIQGDCDEIPRADTLIQAATAPWSTALFSMSLFYFYINCKEMTPERVHKNSRLSRPAGRYLYNAKQNSPVDIVYSNSGWHFSWMGDVQSKLAAWGHAEEYNKPPFNQEGHIQACKDGGKDLFNRRGRRRLHFQFLSDLGYLPAYMQENMGKYEKWIKR
jgi:beta-1,4-mannosyl-glycoprotein beta-1,4-N-acetylglucosaminyltransferase